MYFHQYKCIFFLKQFVSDCDVINYECIIEKLPILVDPLLVKELS